MVRLRQEAVGEEIRRLREQKGLSLRALAGATDFSPSFISQLENGLVSPSIASMERIVGTLGVSLGEFFASLATSGAGGHVVRSHERVLLPSDWSHATIEILSPKRRNGALEPLLIELAPGGRSGKHPTAPSREEFAYVVEGELELTLGPDRFRVKAGDSVTILKDELRRWLNDGAVRARILVVASR